MLFHNHLLYTIVAMHRRIDNTDQRVASAIGDFTLGMGGVLVGNLDSQVCVLRLIYDRRSGRCTHNSVLLVM